jgi:hypothetical protein
MAEKVLPEPLSGAEIKKAFLFKVGQMLDRDCNLNPEGGYRWFSGSFSFHLTVEDVCGTSKVDAKDVTVTQGLEPEDGAELSEASGELEIEPDLEPNKVRVGTDQPVPILTTDTNGKKTIRYQKYRKPKAKK